MIGRFFISGFSTLCFFLIAFSCSSEDTVIKDNSTEIKQIIDLADSGTWRITNYVDSGNNETNDYTGYNFTFVNGGTLTASNGVNTINGTWSVTDQNSNDDDSNDIDFIIFFSAPPNFEELSDDWDIVSTTDTKIELIDISGGNGGTDTLTFEKN
jgi:hypothetical protein